MTRGLYTAKISNVDSIIFINRIRKIVGFELVKEIEIDVFRLVTSVKQRKNSEFSFVLNRHMAAYCMKTLNLDLLLKRGCPMCRIKVNSKYFFPIFLSDFCQSVLFKSCSFTQSY